MSSSHALRVASVLALVVGTAAACGARDSLRISGGDGGSDAGALDANTSSGGPIDGSVVDAPPDGSPDGGPPLLTDSIVSACVIASSCADPFLTTGIPWPMFSPSACVDGFGRLGWSAEGFHSPDAAIAEMLLACAAASKGDCDVLRSCFGGGWVGLSRCREGATCDANKMVIPYQEPAYDCGAIGSTCVDLVSGAQRACCNEQLCTGYDQVTCDESNATGTFCHSWGAFMRFDCSLTGRECTTDPLYYCDGTGELCDVTQYVTHCDEGLATYCAGTRLSTFDCSENLLRSGCGGSDSWALPCSPLGSECSPADFVGSCQGAQLTLCVDGYQHQVDCAELGFSGCDLPAAGYAYCL